MREIKESKERREDYNRDCRREKEENRGEVAVKTRKSREEKSRVREEEEMGEGKGERGEGRAPTQVKY